MTVFSRASCLLAGFILATGFTATAFGEFAQGFNEALAAADRPAEEQERDLSRKPSEVLGFMGIDAGMTVLELFAGGGWYTEVLSAAVGPNGMVYAQNPERFQERLGDAPSARATRLGNVEVIYTLGTDIDVPVPADAAFTALNLHDYANRGDQAGLDFLAGIYAALTPGGILGVVDHVGTVGYDNTELHRMDLLKAQQLLTSAGFVIDGVSNILGNSSDDHTLGIRDPSIRYNTDRMVLRAKKPE
jgi:predicted methyltransferase